MKKKVISILFSVLTLSMLAGCGNDSAPSGGAADNPLPQEEKTVRQMRRMIRRMRPR
ncbi:MAG: hypothetical protein HFH91_20115 [Lachnospiraceae bacterium]|nr:hypothetical protein [Lachnospiraceae bacterium]